MICAKTIDHVCLWVNSLSEAKSYFERVFGFVCKHRANDNSTLVVESENVHFFISETKNENNFLAKQHLSFEVESIAHVISALKEMGITEFDQGEVSFFAHRNYKWCEWRGPNGIRLECVEIIKEKNKEM